jgi:hypothetical protein
VSLLDEEKDDLVANAAAASSARCLRTILKARPRTCFNRDVNIVARRPRVKAILSLAIFRNTAYGRE